MNNEIVHLNNMKIFSQQFSTAMTIIAKSYILSIWQHASWNRRCQWYLKVIKTEIKPAAICSEIQNLLWVAILWIVDAILASVQFWLNRKWRKVISLTPSYRFFLNPKLADFKLGKLKLSFGNNELQNSCNIVRD